MRHICAKHGEHQVFLRISFLFFGFLVICPFSVFGGVGFRKGSSRSNKSRGARRRRRSRGHKEEQKKKEEEEEEELGTHPAQAQAMLDDVTPTLKRIGLDLNESKTSYITTSPGLAMRLPGENANQKGLKILGRTFKFQENTAEELTKRIATTWAKFHRLKRILSAPTPLPHRLTILKACLGQSLLWGSETWHLTRKGLQQLRGAELKMQRAMIPPPPGRDRQNDPHFFDNWKTHIRKTLQENGYIGLDRAWIKRYHSWAGHAARLGANRWAKKLSLTERSNGGGDNKN